MDGNGDYTGFGDTWLGLKYRFLQQTRRRPSLAFFYQAKVPSASVVAGLGSGQVDHAPSLLVSKDLHSVHFDFNVTPLFVGRPVGSGFDHNTGFALSAAAHLIGRLSVVGEGYGLLP
jgi:Putative MetA-pathway of phenol degradation